MVFILRWVFIRILGAVARFAVWLTKGLWNHVPGPLPVKLLATVPVALLAAVLTFLTYFVPLELTSRIFLSDDPTVIVHEGNPESNTNITFLGGAGSSPSVQVSELLPTLQHYAKKVRVVEYAEYLFDDTEVVDAVDDAIEADENKAEAAGTEENEVLVSGSMGGLLSHDVIKQRRSKGDNRRYGAVFYGSPTGQEDVTGVPSFLKAPSGAGLVGWTGFFTSEAVGPAVGMPPFEPGDPAKMSPHINREELRRSNESYENFKTSAWADQGDYVFGHDPITGLSNVKLTFVLAEGDTFVNGRLSYQKWQRAQGTVHEPVQLLTVPGEHMAFHDWPREYAAATEQGLAYIG